MKKQNNEVKKSVYVGMSIFSILKNRIIRINDKIVSFDDKKYLSLYLGIINSENEISEKYSENFSNIYINYKILDIDTYMDIYNNYFIKIFDNIDFDSMENYFEFLLNQEVVSRFNAANKLFQENKSNKRLIKK